MGRTALAVGLPALALAAILIVIEQGGIRPSGRGGATDRVAHPSSLGLAPNRGRGIAQAAPLRVKMTRGSHAKPMRKPPWAVVPATARVLELTVARPGEPPRLSQTFTGASKVQAIAVAVNRMGRSQRGVRPCEPQGPNEHEPEAVFTFRARVEGPVLAQASAPAWRRTESGACDDLLSLAVPGHGTVALGHGKVVEEAEAILGVRIYTYRYRL